MAIPARRLDSHPQNLARGEDAELKAQPNALAAREVVAPGGVIGIGQTGDGAAIGIAAVSYD